MKPLIRIVAVGDLAFNGGYHKRLQTHGPRHPLRGIGDKWDNADLRFGNLESPITERDRVAPSKLTLRGSPLAIDALKSARFDCMSIANNHMMDFGAGGMRDTCRQLDAAGIARVGAGSNLDEALTPAIIKLPECTIGVLAFCDVVQTSPLYATSTNPGVAPAEPDLCNATIRTLRNQVDFVVVHLHWGQEMCRLPSPRQRQFASELISAGTDLILGHHPHVLQPIEILNHSVVAYSLGDFLFSNTFWHGINGGGKSFLAHYQVHPLSRRTGWLEVELQANARPTATFHQATLRSDLTVLPDSRNSRLRSWAELNEMLALKDYEKLLEQEAMQAITREKWRMDGRRLWARIKIKLLQYGGIPEAVVEPDGKEWRSRFIEAEAEFQSLRPVQ